MYKYNIKDIYIYTLPIICTIHFFQTRRPHIGVKSPYSSGLPVGSFPAASFAGLVEDLIILGIWYDAFDSKGVSCVYTHCRRWSSHFRKTTRIPRTSISLAWPILDTVLYDVFSRFYKLIIFRQYIQTCKHAINISC